jgi:RNA polymerase primary sigma factor
VKKTVSDLEQQLGRSPSEGEIAAHLRVSVDSVREARRLLTSPVSLQDPISSEESEEGTAELADFVADKDAISPDEFIEREDFRVALRKALKRLSEEERRFIVLRFGLSEKGEYSLEEIRKKWRLTRGEIGELRQRALRKLREFLSDYF